MGKFTDVSGSENWVKVEKIDKGWSTDEKYYIETKFGEKLILRISAISKYEVKKRDFEMMKKISALNIPTSKPVELGICEDGRKVYVLLTWLEGVDAEEVLSKFSKKKQYEFGVRAGEMLRQIHEIEIEDQDKSWEERFSPKIDRRRKKYEDCVIGFDNAHKIMEYIEGNRKYLEGRPMTFQHGDYHISNMIITKEDEIGIIDFDRADIGDPWEEFNRINWCVDISRYFASGRINGYFGNDVPEEFFKLLGLYIGSNGLGSIPWAIPYGEKEVETMLNQMKKIIASYNGFETHIPDWYIRGDEVEE